MQNVSETAAAAKCPPGEVHVWRIELDCTARSIAALRSTLLAEERERVERFRTAQLRERWTVARGALRCILASYIGSDPAALELRPGSHGKPELAWPVESISFNLSHTCGLALVGIAGTGRVGIDAETMRSDIEVEDLSRRFFAKAEAEEILALNSDARVAAFFTCWTRKEAFVKALGTGLSTPLDHFRVSVRADQPARLLSVDGDQPDRWTLVDLGEPNVAAALAVEESAPVVKRFKFAPPLA